MKRLNNYNTEILKTEIGKTNTKDFKYAVEYFFMLRQQLLWASGFETCFKQLKDSFKLRIK